MCLCVAYFVVMMYLLIVKSLLSASQVKGDTFTCKSRYVIKENAYKLFLRKLTIFEPLVVNTQNTSRIIMT